MNLLRESIKWACVNLPSKLLKVDNVPLRQSFHPALYRPFATDVLTSASSSTRASTVPIESTSEEDKLYKMLEVEVRGNDPAVLKSYTWFASTAASELDIKVGNCWAHRKPVHNRLTLLKSVHIYKKHRVQYEIRTYFRFMQFHHLTGSTADTFLEYIQRNLPEGVAMKVTKVQLQKLPEHLSPPNTTQTQKAISEQSQQT